MNKIKKRGNKVENNKLVFQMPKENEEDFQTIMDNVDLDEIRKAEENNRMRVFKRTQAWGDSGILNNLDPVLQAMP